MAELNCCLVGYGGIAAFHTDALRQLDGVELHTVVGRREEPRNVQASLQRFWAADARYHAALFNELCYYVDHGPGGGGGPLLRGRAATGAAPGGVDGGGRRCSPACRQQ